MTHHWHCPNSCCGSWSCCCCCCFVWFLKHNTTIDNLEHGRLTIDGGDLVCVVLEAHPALVAVLHHAGRVRAARVRVGDALHVAVRVRVHRVAHHTALRQVWIKVLFKLDCHKSANLSKEKHNNVGHLPADRVSSGFSLRRRTVLTPSSVTIK